MAPKAAAPARDPSASSGSVVWTALPVAWVGLYVATFGAALAAVSWSFVDTYAHLRRASELTWAEAVADSFGRDVEYRPFFTLGHKLVWDLVGPELWVYRALTLALYAGLLVLVVRLCRPAGWRRALAACLAVSVLCGLHTTRVMLNFWPLNHHAAAVLLVMTAILLACRPRASASNWAFGLLALAAMFWVEMGLVALPVLVVLRLAGAPGIAWRGVAGVGGATAVYLAVRLTFGSESWVPAVYADSGFGLYRRDVASLEALFGGAPWLFWLYNIGATWLTVVLSEPREGVFQFAESVLARDLAPWNWIHVGTSGATTLVVMAGLARAGWPAGRDRVLLAAGLSLMIFGSLLGFLYTRDRIGLSAGVGYAVLLYVGVAGWLERPPRPGWRRWTFAALVAALTAGWLVRGGEQYLQIRDTALDYHLEWTERYADLGGPAAPPTDKLIEMRAQALAATPVDTRRDPGWTFAFFERRFGPAAPR